MATHDVSFELGATDPTSDELEALVDALASACGEPGEAKYLAARAGFPSADLPAVETARVFWHLVVRRIADGKTRGGLRALIAVAALQYPGNATFARYAPMNAGEAPVTPAAPERCALPRRFRWFTGRADAIAKFDAMVACEPDDWQSLVICGLTGTGKSFLVDYLRHSRPFPRAKVELSPSMDPTQLLRTIGRQLGGPSMAQALEEELSAPVPAPFPRGPRPLQESLLGVDALVVFQAVRFAHQLDALVRVMKRIQWERVVLFIDDVENLRTEWLRHMLLDRLIPRLRDAFTGFRVVFCGQWVPVDEEIFQQATCVTLKPFSPEDTRVMLERIGIVSERDFARIHELTRGLPLRLALLGESGCATEHDTWEDVARSGDERWIRRIYDRLIARLSNAKLREVAPYLTLLDSFDIGIIEATFELTVTRDQLDELVDSQLIEPVAPARWRCHGLVRDALAPRLEAENPKRCREVHEAALAAFCDCINVAMNRTGEHAFAGRMDLVAACLRCASKLSADDMHHHLEYELAVAAVTTDGETVLALDRTCAAIPELEDSAHHRLVRDISRTLGTLLARCAKQADPRPFERLADILVGRDDKAPAARLLSWVALMAKAAGDDKRAIRSAKRAVTLESDDGDLLLELAETLASAGRTEQALRRFDSYQRRFGRTAALAVARAKVAFQCSDHVRGRLILRKAVDEHPNEVAPRLLLAQHLLDRGKYRKALEQVEIVLALEPDHEDAIVLRLELFVELGRWEDFRCELSRAPKTLATIAEESLNHMSRLESSSKRAALMADIAVRPDEVPAALFMGLGGYLAAHGELDQLRELRAICVAHHPQTAPTWTQLEAEALVCLGRVAEAIPILEELCRAGDVFFAPLALSDGYLAAGRLDDARATLEACRRAQPGFRDLASHRLALFVEPDPAQGLRLLEAEPSMGPRMRMARAILLAQLERRPEAIAELESLLCSPMMLDVPVGLGVEIRRLLIVFLWHNEQLDDASKQIDTLVELHPDDPAAIEISASFFAHAGDRASVERVTARWARGEPSEVMRRLSFLASAAVVKDPSIEELISAVRAEPERAELVIALVHRASLEGAVTNEEVTDAVAHAGSTLLELDELAQQLIQRMPPVERQRMLRSWFGGTANDMNSGLTALGVLVYDGRLDEATELVRSLHERFPRAGRLIDEAELRALAGAGHRERVEQRLRPLVDSTVPIDPEQWFSLSLAATRVLPPGQAIAFHQRVARQIAQARPVSLAFVAHLLANQGEHQKALDTWTELYGAKPAVAQANEDARLRALLGLGRVSEALDAIESRPQPARGTSLAEAHVLCLKGHCLRKLKRYPEAEAAYDAALCIRPRHLESLLGLCRCFERQGRWRDAHKALTTALEVAPHAREGLHRHARRLRAKEKAATQDQ
jgi:tetratricopeptide (TPR) repeat protein